MKLKIRKFNEQDWISVSRIYAEGMVTGIATFETEVPSFKKGIKNLLMLAD